MIKVNKSIANESPSELEIQIQEAHELAWLIRNLAEVGQEAAGDENRARLIFKTIYRMADEVMEAAENAEEALP